MARKCEEACFCRNLTCGIVFLTVGAACIVAGGVMAAVGYGTRPKDMFDYRNLSMRVAGLCLVGIGVLPVIMGVMFVVFYCAFKRGKVPGQKKVPYKDVEMSVISKQPPNQNEYPYPADAGPLMYKPSLPDDSLVKYDDLEKDGHYSFASNSSSRMFNNEPGNSNVYAEIKAPLHGGANRTVTTKTTTVTRTYNMEPDSESSGVTFRSETLPEKKARRQKNQQFPGHEAAAGSLSLEVHSFDETDDLPQQKTKRSKKPKRNEPLPPVGDEVFDDMDEPLPGGRFHSQGRDHSGAQGAVVNRSTGSSSFAQENDVPSAAVYGKVKKKRDKKI